MKTIKEVDEYALNYYKSTGKYPKTIPITRDDYAELKECFLQSYYASIKDLSWQEVKKIEDNLREHPLKIDTICGTADFQFIDEEVINE